MNKVKMFFIAAALLLTTAGVFAGKAKFTADPIYGFDGTHTIQLTQTATFVDLTLTSGTAVTIKGTNTYTLYADAAHTTQIFSNGF